MRFRVFRAPPTAPPPADHSGEEPPPEERRAEAELSEDRLSPAGPPVAPVVVPRWIQLVLLPIALLGLWALARAAGPVVLILIAAGTIALILNPLVKMIQRRRVQRGLAILFVYLCFFAVLVGLGVLLTGLVSTQVTRLAHNVPHLVSQANHQLTSFQSWL